MASASFVAVVGLAGAVLDGRSAVAVLAAAAALGIERVEYEGYSQSDKLILIGVST
jgi:hypothetical protein